MSAPVLINVLDTDPALPDLNALDDQIRDALARGVHPQDIMVELDVELSDIVRIVGAGAQR